MVDPANDTPANVLEAVAWESGMDDAPRLNADNGTSTVPNRDENGVLSGHSLNQESVDLNAYLCADKCYLARIARELGARLVINADGLLTNGPTAENYNPNTGEAMNSTNFSWTAALLLDRLHRSDIAG